MRIVVGMLILLCCLASGCSDKDGIPSGIIPREEMGKILWDMVQADQYAGIYLAKDSAFITVKNAGRLSAKDSALLASSYGASPVAKNSVPPGTGMGIRSAAKRPIHLSAKDSARIFRIKDSLRAVQLKDSLRVSHSKDSFRLGLKMKDLALYQQVFQLHQVTRDEFRQSFQFYLDHPEITKPLIDSVLARGNRLRMESYSTPPSHTDNVKKPPVVMPVVSGAPIVTPVLPIGHPGPPPNFLHRPKTAPDTKRKIFGDGKP